MRPIKTFLDVVYRPLGDIELSRQRPKALAGLPSFPNSKNVLLMQLCIDPVIALWMFVGAASFSSWHAIWVSSRAVGVTTSHPLPMQTGAAILAFGSAAFRCTITPILKLCAKPKVMGITAGRIVARVEDVHRVLGRTYLLQQFDTVMQLICPPVRWLSSALPAYLSVALSSKPLHPWPAFVWTTDPDFGPKALSGVGSHA